MARRRVDVAKEELTLGKRDIVELIFNILLIVLLVTLIVIESHA